MGRQSLSHPRKHSIPPCSELTEIYVFKVKPRNLQFLNAYSKNFHYGTWHSNKPLGVYTAEDTGLYLKITFFFKAPAQVWFYTAAPPVQLKSQQVTSRSAVILHTGFMTAHHQQGQSSAGPSWELIKTELILCMRKVCWCHTIWKQQKSRGEAAAAEVPPRGSHQHWRNFLELGVRLLCTVQPELQPPPLPPRLPTPLSSLFLPLVSLPAHANPTPLIHFLLTKTRFYWLPIPPWQNRKHLFPSDL